MVAQFSATNCIETTSPVLDKVSRKKRKFRAEILQSDVTKNDSLLESYFPRQFPVEEPERIPSHCEKGVCKVCGDCDPVSPELEVGLASKIKEESSLCIQERGDWDKSAESELRKLVLIVMDATVKCAIKKIVDCGYSEKVATEAMMRPGICYGSKDTLSNIVDNSLAFLKTSQHLERSIRYRFKDLDELKDYLLAEFVYALQAVRPIFSPSEALWYLLFFDMDVSHACFVIGGQYQPLEDGNTSEKSSKSTQNQLNTLSETLDSNLPGSSAIIQPKLPFPLIKEHATFTFTAQDTKNSNMGETRFTMNVVDQFVAAAGTPQKFISEGKLCNRKPHPLSTWKNVSSPGKKLIHVGKGKCNGGRKGTNKTGRIPNRKSVRVRTILQLPKVTCTASFSAAEADCSFSPGSIKEPIQASVASHSDVNSFKYKDCSNEEINGQPASRDLDTEIIFQLTTRSQIWQNNLKEWSEWANTKVLQATHRLLKNKPELNKLRQEKAETERLEQERKSRKQNIANKLTELGNAVYKTSGKVNVANSAIRRLETENASLRQDMEVAQLQAAKSAANCQEAFERERERLITVQTYVKQKGFLQDDLNAEKLILAEAQKELRKATVSLSRLEVCR